MSNPGASKLQLLVITGNPTVDALIRYGLVAVFMFLTGSITGWLNRAGFHDPNLDTYVGLAVATALSALALSIWGIVRASKLEFIVKLREAIAVQAGINIAESAAPTPAVVTVPVAQKVIAEHATPIPLPETSSGSSLKHLGIILGFLAVLGLLAPLVACTADQATSGAVSVSTTSNTQQHALAAAQAAYTILAEAATVYVRNAHPSAEVKAQIGTYNDRVYAALVSAREANARGNSPALAASLEALRGQVGTMSAYLASLGVRFQPLPAIQ